MNEPSRYRTGRLRPPADKPTHVYVSANSLAWNPATAEQGGTVPLEWARAAGDQGDTVGFIPAEPTPVDPESTAVIAIAPAVRVPTVDDVERELRRPARQDPPIYAELVRTLGLPKVKFLAWLIGERHTTSWPIATQEVETHG